MASGKTTAGQLLATKLGWQFADVDANIERDQGVTVRELFQTRGENAFRELESSAITSYISTIQCGRPWVLALGGGAFIQEANWRLIHNNGISVWLDCPLTRVQGRLNGDTTRPLASDPDRIAELFQMRKSLYARADFRVDADCDDPDEVVGRILNLPIF